MNSADICTLVSQTKRIEVDGMILFYVRTFMQARYSASKFKAHHKTGTYFAYNKSALDGEPTEGGLDRL